MSLATEENPYANPEGVAAVLRQSLTHAKPPERLLPSEWAEQNVKIPPGNAIPGFVRFRNAPHQVEPLNLVADPDVREITLMWGAQTGKTQVMLMAQGFFVDHDPHSQIMMQPSQGDLQTWLTAKFDPMVENADSLRDKVAAPRSRGGVNNQRMKQYPGGHFMFAWSGSPKTMRGRSAPKIYADEIDGYEQTLEGNPLSLIKQRSATFGDLRLFFKTSTPTYKGASAIETSFEAGDRRRWFVECPHCDGSQYFKWSGVQWQKTEAGEHLPDTARYVCEHCGVLWSEVERTAAIRGGRWVAERPFAGHASFHLPEMASLFVKLPDLVREFLQKKAMGDLQTFINVSLAETWDEEGSSMEPDLLYARREEYRADVPSFVSVLVAGVDVQDDRLEVSVYGFGGDRGEKTALITHDVFRGDPGQRELWDRLDQFLKTEFQHEDGPRLRLAAVGVDSGGHYTTQVYKFCKARTHRRVYALKGSNQRGAPIVGRPSNRNAVGVDLYSVGTDTAKELVFGRLSVTDRKAAGYVHFPLGNPLIDAEFFAQLCAEKRVTTYRNGFPIMVYKPIRPRNEALDCLVYTVAALEILRPSFKAIEKKLRPGKETVEKRPEKPAKDDDLAPKKVALKRRQALHGNRRKKNFIKSW